MSLDISFEKCFTLEDVENKTSIKVRKQDGNYCLYKNNSYILAKTYVDTEEDIELYVEQGLTFETIGKDTFYLEGDEKIKIIPDLGLKNIIHGVTRYGTTEMSEIMDELVLTFQTRFITDEEEQMIHYNNTIDIDELYSKVTTDFGYKIKDGIITL